MERGTIGPLPYAAFGKGAPVVALGGLLPMTGVARTTTVRSAVGMFSFLARRHRLVALNRRAGLPQGMTMAQLAAEHADAIRAGFDGPVDVVGLSTGGSIALQLAADHPDVVRRLVAVGAACRLAPEAKAVQRAIAVRIRAGALRQADAVMGADLVPPGVAQVPLAALFWLLGPLVMRDRQGLDDMATTIEAEDGFDLAACPQIQAPTLIIAGSKDTTYTPALFEETAALIPGSTLELIPGRGHVTMLRDRRFRPALEGFLAP